MRDWILIADDLRDLATLGAPFRMMTSRDYVLQPKLLSGSRPKIINLARNYNYQTDGYYASLLAEARGHRVIPSVETMLDLYDSDISEDTSIPELEETLNKDREKAGGDYKVPERFLVCFGETEDERLKGFGRLCFDWYRAPVLVVTTEINGKAPMVEIKRLKLASFTTLKGDELKFFVDALTKYTGRVWKSPKARTIAKHSIAVLFDPNEKMPPSSVDSLQHWARLAEKDGVEIEPITNKDLAKLAEFDWRVGVLDRRAIFVCQYKMARGHWQIVNYKDDGKWTEGGFRSLSVAEAPADVVDVGVRAANLIGDGFYGVDIKTGPDGPVVIEINDNPNLEHGIEDATEKTQVWSHLTEWFVKRLNA
jgi:glutathione synthase/RimK-type ligase-like ATP-grasp enzyme